MGRCLLRPVVAMEHNSSIGSSECRSLSDKTGQSIDSVFVASRGWFGLPLGMSEWSHAHV